MDNDESVDRAEMFMMFDPHDKPLKLTLRHDKKACIAHAERHTGKGYWKMAQEGYRVRETSLDVEWFF